MPSPFPGMDPFLEDQFYWEEFHQRFVNVWSEAIADRLPDQYEARLDVRMNFIEMPEEETKQVRPDIAVIQHRPSSAMSRRTGGAVGLLEPVRVPVVIMDPERQISIKILRRPGRQIVTILELLSPTNKTGTGYRDFTTRRESFFHQQINVVELGLLLGGRRLSMAAPLPPGDYYAMVTRAEDLPDSDVYAWTIRDPLPTIPVPLLPPDADVPLDLAAVFRTAYARGRYDRSIDYAAPLSLSLPPDDRSWAEATARGAARLRNGPAARSDMASNAVARLMTAGRGGRAPAGGRGSGSRVRG